MIYGFVKYYMVNWFYFVRGIFVLKDILLLFELVFGGGEKKEGKFKFEY